MVSAATFAAALAAGALLRTHLGARFAVAFRLQLVLLVLPLGVMGGWAFRPTVESTIALGLVFVGELAAIAAGAALHGHAPDRRFVAAGSQLNSSFWSVPIASAVFGPEAAVLPIVFETLLSPFRSNLAIWLLRSRAPEQPSGRTALVDYSRAFALAAGLALQAVTGGAPGGVTTAISVLGYVVAAAGFVLLGLALPRTIPRRAWARAARVLPLRFVPSTVLLALAAGAGMHVPPGAWVLALAPSWFAYLSWARLYGHSTEHAAAVVLLTLPVAALMLPVVSALGSLS